MDSPNDTSTLLEQVTKRVDRLLARHAHQQLAQMQLQAQVDTLTQERDSLKSRLSAARARIDALLNRLNPADDATPAPGDQP